MIEGCLGGDILLAQRNVPLTVRFSEQCVPARSSASSGVIWSPGCSQGQRYQEVRGLTVMHCGVGYWRWSWFGWQKWITPGICWRWHRGGERARAFAMFLMRNWKSTLPEAVCAWDWLIVEVTFYTQLLSSCVCLRLVILEVTFFPPIYSRKQNIRKTKISASLEEMIYIMPCLSHSSETMTKVTNHRQSCWSLAYLHW